MTEYRVTPELNQFFLLLNNGKKLADAVSRHLDKEEQGRMYDIVKDVLSDEVALILEVEIRRKAFKETHGLEPYMGNRMIGDFE